MTKRKALKDIKFHIDINNGYLTGLLNRNAQRYYTKEMQDKFFKDINEIIEQAKLTYNDLISYGIIGKDNSFNIKTLHK